MQATLTNIQYIRQEIDELYIRLHEAMITDLPIGTQVVFRQRTDELIGEVVSHSATNLCLQVWRDGETMTIDLEDVIDIA